MANTTNAELPTSKELVQIADTGLMGMTDAQCRDALGFLIGFTAVNGQTHPWAAASIAWAKAKAKESQ
jgi:hypothetical protein